MPLSPADPVARPSARVMADALAAVEAPPVDSWPRSLAALRSLLRQWQTALALTGIAELAGLTDDLRELDERLGREDASPAWPAALHRVGLSLKRVAVWAQPAGLTEAMQTLGRQLLERAAALAGREGA